MAIVWTTANESGGWKERCRRTNARRDYWTHKAVPLAKAGTTVRQKKKKRKKKKKTKKKDTQRQTNDKKQLEKKKKGEQ